MANEFADLLGNIGEGLTAQGERMLYGDRTSPSQAKQMGHPEYSGLNPEQLRILANQPQNAERLDDEKTLRDLRQQEILLAKQRIIAEKSKQANALPPKQKEKLKAIDSRLKEISKERGPDGVFYHADMGPDKKKGYAKKIDDEYDSLKAQHDEILGSAPSPKTETTAKPNDIAKNTAQILKPVKLKGPDGKNYTMIPGKDPVLDPGQ